MKNFISTLIILCLVFISGMGTVFAEKKEITKEEKQKIKEVYSFSEEHIEDISDEKLSEYLIDIDTIKVSKKEQYFKIDYDVTNPKKPKKIKTIEVTKEEVEVELEKLEESNNQMVSILSVTSCGNRNGYDCVQESGFIKLETWVAKNTASEGKVSARFEWIIHPGPFYRDKDVFAIGLNKNFSPIPGTESAVYKADYFNWAGIQTTYEANYTTATKRDAGGYGYTIDLHDNGFNHRGYMEYKFSRNLTNVTLADAYSHYAHQERTFSISPSYSLPAGGSLSLSSSTSFSIMTGHAQLNPW